MRRKSGKIKNEIRMLEKRTILNQLKKKEEERNGTQRRRRG
jgi:hypothetical protein